MMKILILKMKMAQKIMKKMKMIIVFVIVIY